MGNLETSFTDGRKELNIEKNKNTQNKVKRSQIILKKGRNSPAGPREPNARSCSFKFKRKRKKRRKIHKKKEKVKTKNG